MLLLDHKICLVFDYVHPDIQPVNWRLCKLRIRGRFHNFSFICIHAPTEDKNENLKDSLYELLEKEYNKCPKNDIKLIMGNFIAKTGQEDKLKPSTGKHNYTKTVMITE
jgi:hypothetical protein